MTRKMDIDKTQYDFQFTRNWFRNRNLATFRKFVHPQFTNKPTTYLEIGVFEGMSMVWMLQRVLRHSDSRAVGVDPWLMTRKLDAKEMHAVLYRAFHNIYPWVDKCQLQQGNSAEVLRRMGSKRGFAGIKPNSVDLCMIDGGHNELAVWDDARIVYPLMKDGSWVIFDDVENDNTKPRHVKQGLDFWLKEIGDGVKEVFRHKYMVGYEVVK